MEKRDELRKQMEKKELEMGALEGRVEELRGTVGEVERERDALREGIRALVECKKEEEGRWECVLKDIEAPSVWMGGKAVGDESWVGRRREELAVDATVDVDENPLAELVALTSVSILAS